MGPTLSRHRGPVFKTTQFLRPDVIMKILGRARWDDGSCCCCTLGGQLPEIWHQSKFACCLHIIIPSPSLFVCRLNTIMETLNRVWQTPWYKQDRVTEARQSTADIISARKGKLNICPPQLTVQCLSQTGVGRGRMGKYVPIYIEAVWGGNLRKAYKQTLGETSRNNFSPLSVLSMQDGRVYNFLNSCSKVKYFRNNLCSLFPHISRQMSKSAEWAPGLTGLSSPRFSEFVSPVERGKN